MSKSKAVFISLLLTLSASPVVLPVFVHPAQAITQTQVGGLKKGMTPQQVKTLLGMPKFTSTNNGVTMWTYPLGSSFIGVHFRGGKVVRWGKLEG